MLIVIEDYRPPSLNQIYSGVHWSKRKRMADEAHALVRANIDPDVEAFNVPVEIRVTAYFKNRALDPDNIPAKILIDGLIPLVIADDSPKYVASVTTISRVDKDRPRVEIVVRPCR